MDLMRSPHSYLKTMNSFRDESHEWSEGDKHDDNDIIDEVTGDYDYWHYICDGTDDRGWGCGYRTAQTIISWIHFNINKDIQVPSLRKIQEILVNIEDKPASFVGSREWIGSVEVGLVIDSLSDIPVKMVHVRSGDDLKNIFPTLQQHFRTRRCPVMMGGNEDCSSKGVVGTKLAGDKKYLLIVDPHYFREAEMEHSPSVLINQGWIKWREINTFLESSFYNLALPQA